MSTPSKAGWYDDPEAPDQLRYFDGVVWTRHTAPRTTRASAPRSPAHPPVSQPPGSQAPAAPNADPYGWREPQSPEAPPAGPPAYGQQPQQWGQPSQQPQQWGQPPQQPQQWGQQPQQWGGAPGWSAPSNRPTGPMTPDGVPLAGYWQRVGAFVLDGLIMGVLTAIFGGYFLMRALDPWLDDFVEAINSSNTTTIEQLSNNLSTYLTGRDFFTFAAISVVVGLVYQVFFWTRFGATPGKMALRISVRRREEPGPLPLPVALRRYLITLCCAIISFLPNALSSVATLVRIADLLWPAWDGRRQALHDKVAGTQVVQGSQPRPNRKSRP